MMELQYFRTGQTRLSVECYVPEKSKGKALVFYYGGGWINDNRHRFRRFAEDLADQGITVFLPQYRVYDRNGTFPFNAAEDVSEGLSFVRSLYEQYGIKRNQVIWGGGSAGAHLILCQALIPLFREKAEPLPGKMVLFNPVCCPHSLYEWVKEQCGAEFDFTGLCPLHNMEAPEILPEILAMHGTEDKIAPFKNLIFFKKEYEKRGGKCRIVSYPGRVHGFHHPHVSESDYRDTLYQILDFIR